MSYQGQLREMIHAKRPDVTVAVIGVLLSISLLGLQFLTYRPLIVVIPLSTGLACSAYLATVNRRPTEVKLPTLGTLAAGYLPALVVFGLAGFVALVVQAGARTLPAYLLAAGIGSLIFGQILLLDESLLNAPRMLLQILAAAVVIPLAGLLVTPGYVGVDIWTHLPVFVQGIVDTGTLAGLEGSKYLLAPIYHAFAAVGTTLFGSPRMAVYLTLGLIVPLSVLFVYGAGSLLLPTRWALLATALFAFSEHAIEWGMHLIPQSLGLVFLLGVFYCVTRIFMRNAEREVVALLGLFSVAVVFTHQVSTAILLAFLGIAAIVAVSMDVARGWPFKAGLSRTTRPLAGVFLSTTVLTLISWANTPHSGDSIFLWDMLTTTQELFAESAGFLNLPGDEELPAYAVSGGGGVVDLLVPYVVLAGFAILLCVAVVGGLVLFRWDQPVDVSLTYQLVAAGFFVATFGFSIFGFRAFLPGRWLAFLYIPLALLGAMGVYYLYRTTSRRVVMAAVIVLALAYPGSMIVSESATMDSPAFEDQFVRFSYTEAEVSAVRTISTIHPPSAESAIATDHPYSTLFSPLGGYTHETLALGADSGAFDGPVVYREYQSTGPVSFTVPGEEPRPFYSRSVAAGIVCPPERNVAYANDQVRLCTSTATTEGVR